MDSDWVDEGVALWVGDSCETERAALSVTDVEYDFSGVTVGFERDDDRDRARAVSDKETESDRLLLAVVLLLSDGPSEDSVTDTESVDEREGENDGSDD